jgi:hypothetical protein
MPTMDVYDQDLLNGSPTLLEPTRIGEAGVLQGLQLLGHCSGFEGFIDQSSLNSIVAPIG